MDMDEMELRFLRFLDRCPRVPTWAEAERMERSVPQRVLWHCDPSVSERI